MHAPFIRKKPNSMSSSPSPLPKCLLFMLPFAGGAGPTSGSAAASAPALAEEEEANWLEEAKKWSEDVEGVLKWDKMEEINFKPK